MCSWELVADELPDCMKHVLEKVFQSYQIIEQELSEDEKYRMPYLRSFVSHFWLHIFGIYLHLIYMTNIHSICYYICISICVQISHTRSPV